MRRVEAVQEVLVGLAVDGRRIATFACTPADLDALAVGWLLASDLIEGPSDIAHIQAGGGRDPVVQVRLSRGAEGPMGAAAQPGDSGGASAAGASAYVPRAERPSAAAAAPPAADAMQELFRLLFSSATRGREAGGHHIAALSDGHRLLAPIEDVARHSAVDKVIGRALLEGVDTAGLGLVLSARVSGEIARKAARARLGWIASRSVPTTLALEIAGAAGIDVIARAASPDSRLFGADHSRSDAP